LGTALVQECDALTAENSLTVEINLSGSSGTAHCVRMQSKHMPDSKPWTIDPLCFYHHHEEMQASARALRSFGTITAHSRDLRRNFPQLDLRNFWFPNLTITLAFGDKFFQWS
jgi:hypothetical protein